MRDHARTAWPDEAVGAVLGRTTPDGGAIATAYRPMTNLAPTPRDRFTVDPSELCSADGDARDAGLELLGLFHSHPDGRSSASAADRGADWPGRAVWIGAVDRGGRFELAAFHVLAARIAGDQNRSV